jgi:MOSC domain-containing protein YiiM/ferredoxin-NADP reductase
MSYIQKSFSPGAIPNEVHEPKEIVTAAVAGSVLLAVFAGRVSPLGAKGVPSAFVKLPVHGLVEANRLGIVGDSQADLSVHGGVDKAIYAYPTSNYPLWRRDFPQHSAIWSFGSLGENLAIAGLDENRVCIGDVYRLGTAVLQVTQPRKPCFKLALRYDGDQRIAGRMVNECRTGWYFRVLKCGNFSEGQAIDLLESPHPRWSVAMVNRAAYDRDTALEDLHAIAALPELSDAWRSQIVAAANGRASGKNALPSFFRYGLAEARMESATVRSLVFKPLDGVEVLAHQPGQHVQVNVPLPSGGIGLRRYTISSSPSGKSLQISVKKEEGGLVSPLLHKLRIGDEIEISRPQGRFVLDRSAGRPVAFISAGVGITPTIPMLNAAVVQDGRLPFVPKIVFLHAARDGTEHAFVAQIQAMLSKHPDATSKTFYSRPTEFDRATGAFDVAGRITAKDVAALVSSDYDIYMCGPDEFMASISEGLAQLGFPRNLLKTETFDFEGALAKASDGTERAESNVSISEVKFSRSNTALAWKKESGTLLQAMEAKGISWTWDCRIGVCGTCSVKILAGSVSHVGLQGGAPLFDEALLCCAVPATATLVLDV